jgi:hypothetical protein
MEIDPPHPALLRIGRDSVELRKGTDPPGKAGSLAIEVYGIDDPAVGSENLQIERVVTATHRDLQGQGVSAADCRLGRLHGRARTWPCC